MCNCVHWCAVSCLNHSGGVYISTVNPKWIIEKATNREIHDASQAHNISVLRLSCLWNLVCGVGWYRTARTYCMHLYSITHGQSCPSYGDLRLLYIVKENDFTESSGAYVNMLHACARAHRYAPSYVHVLLLLQFVIWVVGLHQFCFSFFSRWKESLRICLVIRNQTVRGPTISIWSGCNKRHAIMLSDDALSVHKTRAHLVHKKFRDLWVCPPDWIMLRHHLSYSRAHHLGVFNFIETTLLISGAVICMLYSLSNTHYRKRGFCRVS